ncbi:hypothetical protein AKN93_07290 [Thiopseudomonas alkaliphila]|uniref:BON domain-containing protein n=1 Tax=Thiopseudomonas alkaliphila TaxID=1697053 RepID=UPI00069FC922|nr:BON domain-containing protein [Thiopseudomonas alkaliphila]AKX49230.1 hypothetical protein AKN93_07290 [Thiopseudomonas alkaliphila]
MKTTNKFACVAMTTALLAGLPLSQAFAENSVKDSVSHAASEVKEASSDTWITSKVKSTFLADHAISGLDIKVETNNGMVSLSGTVNTPAERDLAIERAQGIKGVTNVAADGLKVTGHQ